MAETTGDLIEHLGYDKWEASDIVRDLLVDVKPPMSPPWEMKEKLLILFEQVRDMERRLARIEQAEQEAEARKGDPVTSKYAANSVDEMARRHRDLWWCLYKMAEPVTDELLCAVYTTQAEMGVYKMQSHQSIRSRRAELVRMGFVQAVDRKGETNSGRMATRWEAVGMAQQPLFVG